MRKPHANLDQLIPLIRHSSLFNREHREAEATLDSDIHVLTNHGLLFLCRADMKWHSPKIACHHSFAYPLKTKHAEIHAPPIEVMVGVNRGEFLGQTLIPEKRALSQLGPFENGHNRYADVCFDIPALNNICISSTTITVFTESNIEKLITILGYVLVGQSRKTNTRNLRATQRRLDDQMEQVPS